MPEKINQTLSNLFTRRSLKKFAVCVGLIVLPICHFAHANRYELPAPGNSVIGRLEVTSSEPGDTLSDVGLRYDVGYNQITAANPKLSRTGELPTGSQVILPTKFILPPGPRKGIVINLAEMRLYYYLPESDSVITHPVGIGQLGKTIPIMKTYVVRKVKNPVWIPTPSIRAYNEAKGVTLPHIMPPGPDNPLGPYAIYLGIPTYLIHSTIFPESVGRRASFGCIRMKQEDIEDMFPLVTPKMPVTIIDVPYKTGWQDDKLYLEAHSALEEDPNAKEPVVDTIVASIKTTADYRKVALVDWQLVNYLTEKPNGIPQQIGVDPGN